MKFIHIADLHMDTAFTSLENKAKLGNTRRQEQRETLKKVIDYIIENNIEFLFISGDFYENNYIRKTTIEYINNLFLKIPETKIFISPGNHDPLTRNSYYNKFTWADNVHIFKNKIEKVSLPNVNIYGFGFNNFYSDSSKVEEIELEEKNKINILVVHGDLDQSQTIEEQYNPISSAKLQKVGFDYVALGHIHNQMIKESLVYPGSLISLGFDEPGEHGMIVGEIKDKKLTHEFITIDERKFYEKPLDITAINEEELLIEIINNTDKEAMYKIILEGTRNFEINLSRILEQITNENILKIKDNTKTKYDLDKIKEENNLRGMFVKEMLEMGADETAIEIGLEVL